MTARESKLIETKRGIEIRVERTISAPPHAVYRAWLEPELVRLWLAPGAMDVSRVQIDERVGGRFRIWQSSSGQDAGGFECQLAELVPDRRIVFHWGFVGPNRTAGPTFDSVLTITLREAPGDATSLTLLHQKLDGLERAMPHVARNVGTGWELVVDKLATLLSPGPK